MKRSVLSLIEDTLFPPRCVGCGNATKTNAFPLCDVCLHSIPRHTYLFCPKCGNRIPQCMKMCHPDRKYVLGAAVDFNNHITQNLIHSFKYAGQRRSAHPIGDIVAEYVLNNDILNFLDNPLVFCVPIHKKKLRARGYNQAGLLAHAIVERIDSKYSIVENGVLIKTRETASQTTCITVPDRRKNISGSFEITDRSRIQDRDIIIIDDVHTTGATMSEIAILFKKNGARNILALVFAKT